MMSDQGALFDVDDGLKPWQRPSEPIKLARAADPETSHAAAKAIALKAGTWRTKVFAAIVAAGSEGVTHHQLLARFPGAAESTIRTRCAELVEAGLVVDTGRRRNTVSGLKAIVWGVA